MNERLDLNYDRNEFYGRANRENGKNFIEKRNSLKMSKKLVIIIGNKK